MSRPASKAAGTPGTLRGIAGKALRAAALTPERAALAPRVSEGRRAGLGLVEGREGGLFGLLEGRTPGLVRGV